MTLPLLFPFLYPQITIISPLHLISFYCSLLIAFSNSNFYNIQMLTYSSSFKAKPKVAPEFTNNYLSTFPNQPARKTVNNAPVVPQKEKVYRKMNTEANQPQVFDDGKRMAKGMKFPLKAGSPGLKRTIIETTSPSSKLCFNNAGKIKRVKKADICEKAITETGPIIQRTMNSQIPKHFQKDKKWDIFDYKRDSCELKKENTFQSKKENMPMKKLHQSKSGNLYMKARMNTEGTMDSTPAYSNSCDIDLIELIGQGTFGKVFKGRMKKTGEIVAVKKVFQDPKYKNREVEIVSMLRGDFVMKVLGNYTTIQESGQYLNIVMSFYDGDLYGLIRETGRKGMSTLDIKLLTYQIFRGLLSIHHLRIAHRDIKPHNILYKGKKAALCDFGSAKILTNQPNLPYICSRCYRAPQLIFGATHYTTMIDIWSVGCVILEMINGSPLFIGQSSIDHLIEIIKVLGTPTKTQVIDMNPNYDLNDYKFPKVKKREWNKIFPKADPLLLDLISQIMIYSPKQRLNAAEALAHEFFDELREEQIYRQLHKQFGLNLFSFSSDQIRGQEHLVPKLIPPWYKQHKEFAFF